LSSFLFYNSSSSNESIGDGGREGKQGGDAGRGTAGAEAGREAGEGAERQEKKGNPPAVGFLHFLC